MTLPRLRVAHVATPSSRTTALTELIRSLDHEVVVHGDARAYLAAPEADLVLLDLARGDDGGGLGLLAALRGAGRSVPVVLVAEQLTFDDMKRAVELGASDVLLGPLEREGLARSLERACSGREPRPRAEGPAPVHACERTYPAAPDAVGRAAREASAFLVNEGVASAHRVRIASAIAELVDNSVRHGYSGRAGEVRVRVEVHHARVHLSVSDSGTGFDAPRARLESVPPALPGSRPAKKSGGSGRGLGRVEQLCEAHTVSSGPAGTQIDLVFELTPVRFEEEGEHLAETDFLDPERARDLIAALSKGRADLSGLPPSMALTIGRIIGGLSGQRRSALRTNERSGA
jgi:anti-sigma regulatory factor (Ser/Thr protein kinase)/CheY-like chemotaxis protein